MTAEAGPRAAQVGGLDPLLDFAPCGFLSFADDGTIRLVNHTLLEMLGYSRGDLVGGHVERLLSVGSRIFYQTHWFPLLRMHGRADEIFLMLRAADGEDVGVLINAVRGDREGGAAYDCVLIRVRERQKYESELLEARRTAEGALADLRVRQAELQEANAQLESQAVELELQQQQLQEQAADAELLRDAADEANRAKSAFLAVMSHELRTPLNAIGGYVEILRMGIHGPVTDAQSEALARVDRSQRHLLRLINDVLNLARIEAGRVEYHVRDVDLRLSVAEVAPMVEPQLEQKGVAFTVDAPVGVRARADPDKVQQILLNLLGNAVKFTPAGGRVGVEAVRVPDSSGRVLLRVSDTGIGIPAEKLETVFHPFVQVDVSRTRSAQGTGLGLAISRDLARGMGGDLTVRSTPGEGSTFILALPPAEGAGG